MVVMIPIVLVWRISILEMFLSANKMAGHLGAKHARIGRQIGHITAEKSVVV